MTVMSSLSKRASTRCTYETTYEWNEERQRRVQHRRRIGHFDPETGKVVPNGRRGRPRAGAATGKAGRPEASVPAVRSE